MKRFTLLSLSVVLASVLLAYTQQSQPAKEQTAVQSPDAGLPVNFQRYTGDLDDMVKRGSIRTLVLYSRSSFFYVDGRPQGLNYEALRELEQFVNQKLHTRQKVQVVFIPVRPDQLESYLTEGIGDLVAYPVVVTAARQQQVAFSLPLETGVKQVLVTARIS